MIVRRAGPTFLVTTPEKIAQNPKSFGTRRLARPDVGARPAGRGVDADLQRHLALVQRVLLRREHARPRLEEVGRHAARHGPRPLVAGRPELAAVADGRRAERVAHLHRRRRHGAAAAAAVADLHGPARGGPRDRPDRRVPPGEDLRADRLQRRPGRRRSRGRTSTSRKATSWSRSTATRCKAGDNPYQYLQVTRGQKVSVYGELEAHGSRGRAPTRSSRSARSRRSATTGGWPTTSTRCSRRRTARSATCTSRR